MSNEHQKDVGKNQIELHVATPKGPWERTVPKTTKVIQVIDMIVADLRLPKESFQLMYESKSLEPQDRPLVSFGLPDKVQLVLAATGSGV